MRNQAIATEFERELVDENRRLRSIIRSMGKRGDFAAVALVEWWVSDDERLNLVVCTADRSEEKIAIAIMGLLKEFGFGIGPEGMPITGSESVKEPT